MSDDPESNKNDKPVVKRAVRSSKGTTTKKAGGSRKRKAAPKKKSPVALIAVVATVLVIGAIVLVLNKSDDKKSDDSGSQEFAKKVEDSEAIGADAPAKTTNSIFDAEAANNQATGDEETRKRIPPGINLKTLDMAQLTKHLGHLYLKEETAQKINKLQEEVDRFTTERWHVTKEMKAELKALRSQVDRERGDKFLSAADSEVDSFNRFTEKRELHLRDAENNLLPEPFIGIAFEPYVFMVQAHRNGGEKEIAAKMYNWVKQFKDHLLSYFDGKVKMKPSERHKLIKMVIFRRHKDYINYTRIKDPDRDRVVNALAHYEPDKRRLCIPMDFGNAMSADKEHNLREVLFHEATHQIMHYYTNKSHLSAYGSMWSDEGVAEFFAGHAIEDGKIKFGRINSRISSIVRDQKDMRLRISMKDLLTWSRATNAREEAKGEQAKRDANIKHLHVYSQGWALVYFLNYYKGGIYKDKFMDIMRYQVEDGDFGMSVFRKRVFNGEGQYDKVEAEYFDYMDRMTDAVINKEIKNHSWDKR